MARYMLTFFFSLLPTQYASEVLAIGSGNVSGSKGSLFRPSFGLAHTASYLWRNREKLFGVLNGIDLDVWYLKNYRAVNEVFSSMLTALHILTFIELVSQLSFEAHSPLKTVRCLIYAQEPRD